MKDIINNRLQELQSELKEHYKEKLNGDYEEYEKDLKIRIDELKLIYNLIK